MESDKREGIDRPFVQAPPPSLFKPALQSSLADPERQTCSRSSSITSQDKQVWPSKEKRGRLHVEKLKGGLRRLRHGRGRMEGGKETRSGESSGDSSEMGEDTDGFGALSPRIFPAEGLSDVEGYEGTMFLDGRFLPLHRSKDPEPVEKPSKEAPDATTLIKTLENNIIQYGEQISVLQGNLENNMRIIQEYSEKLAQLDAASKDLHDSLAKSLSETTTEMDQSINATYTLSEELKTELEQTQVRIQKRSQTVREHKRLLDSLKHQVELQTKSGEVFAHYWEIGVAVVVVLLAVSAFFVWHFVK